MLPFRFGPPQRQLMAVYHPAAPARTPSSAVLLCNPLGQEAVRTHRMFRVLAERLARAGRHVLRFDYFGTGDSAGEDAEGQLTTWRDDILLAHRELARRAGTSAVSWVGVRLGGSLACMAAATELTPAPERLVLWEPLADGSAYLSEMARQHQRALRASYSLVPERYRRAEAHEALGFELGDVLRQQLSALRPDTLPLPNSGEVVLISGAAQRGAAALAKRLAAAGRAHRSVAFEHVFDWSSEEALNTALVPGAALQVLCDALGVREHA